MKLRVKNSDSILKPLWLEPWGEDYWLQPDEELDIVARNVDEASYFHVDCGAAIMVWAEGQVTDIGVFKEGSLLQCGYQRV